MQTLKHVDPLSIAKIAAIIELVVGILAAVVIVTLGSAFHGIYGTSMMFGSRRLLLLIIIPLFAVVVGFVAYALEAVIYNFVAEKFGGIKLQFKGSELKTIDVMSTTKIAAFAGIIIGIIFAIIFGLIIAVSTGAGAGLIAAVAILVVLIISFIIIGLLASFVYNVLASAIGGIRINIKQNTVKSVGIMSYAKIEALGCLIIGIVVGIFYTILYYLTINTSATLPAMVSRLGPFSLIAYPIFYFVLGFVSSLLVAWLYNWLSDRLGGVQILLK
ncbi:MAG: hypothetical protein ABR981_02020 [Candidatus Micrarchaeaceae archaeon]|jgi:hypothetical protein